MRYDNLLNGVMINTINTPLMQEDNNDELYKINGGELR